jgi:hypothetical protein
MRWNQTLCDRLFNQGIVPVAHDAPEKAVAALGTMQAQEWPGVLWSIGLRTRGAGMAGVETAVAGRRIVRTWLMRGTLHVAAAEDVRWLLDLLGPRLIAASASRRRQLGLNEPVLARSRKFIAKNLRGDRPMARDTLYGLLERERLANSPQQKRHILFFLALEGLVCFAAHQGKQPAFALLDEWVLSGRRLDRPEALAELARRYFFSRAPATLADFSWWSGLTMADARSGLEAVSASLVWQKTDGQLYWIPAARPASPPVQPSVFLLPGFDEYLLGYKERRAALDPLHAGRVCPGGNGIFRPTLVVDGRVRGTWGRLRGKKNVTLALQLFAPLNKAELQAVETAAESYGRFLGGAAVRIDRLS